MRNEIVLAIVIFCSVSLLAQEKIRLNVKEGLWETTHTTSMSGVPPIPEDTLAKLTPEQRARMEEMMKQRGLGGGGRTNVTKSCVTKEKLDKSMAFDDRRDNCTRTIVSSSASHLEVKFHCAQEKVTSDGTAVVDVTSGETTKGSVHVVSNGGGHAMTSDFTFTSRYLGPACGDVK